MNIDTNIGCFSDFKTLYRVMCEDDIKKIYIENADYWGAQFAGNEWLTREQIHEIIEPSQFSDSSSPIWPPI